MLGLDNILSDEKLDRLMKMAETMERVADKMEAAANTAKEAADQMMEAAILQRDNRLDS